MDRRKRRTRSRAVAVFAVVCAVTAVVPAAASAQGNLVDELLKGLLGGSDGGQTGGADQPDSRAGSPPNYTPPLHGSNPHGQGTVGAVDITPDNTLPQPSDPPPEDITIGDSRGEQNADGTYHGRVYLLHANILGLINTDGILPPVETNEGETATSPLAGLQAVIDSLVCPPLMSPAGCVELAAINSTTSSTGSQNSFELVGTDISLDPGGVNIANVQSSTASSSGDINETSTCQTSTGESNVEDADVGLLVLPVISADALQSSSTSTACNDGTQQNQSNNSTVVALQGGGLPLPAAGCADGTPDTNFTALIPLIGTVCNADDSNNGQTTAPYGVREALTVFALSVLPGGDSLLKVTTSGAESHAVAPAAATSPTTPTTPTTPGNPGGNGNPGNGPGDGPTGGPTTSVAQAGDGGELAFTGASLLWLGLIGGLLMFGGLALARASTKRHSRATA